MPVFDPIDATLLPEVKSIVALYGVFDRIDWLKDGFPFSRLFFSLYAGEKALNKDYIPPIPVAPMDLLFFDNLPPVLIVVDSKDNLQTVSKNYDEHLRKQFTHAEFKLYEGSKHGFFSAGTGSEELIKDMLNYYKKL